MASRSRWSLPSGRPLVAVLFCRKLRRCALVHHCRIRQVTAGNGLWPSSRSFPPSRTGFPARFTMNDLPAPPSVPCGSCPYRRDVPSGIWHSEEYQKLPLYDGETWEQSPALFMCHQNDGCLCGGWLLSHDRNHLLALRLHVVDDSVWDYDPGIDVFSSGAAAMAHGLKDIDNIGPEAQRKIAGLQRQKTMSKKGASE